MPHNKYRPLLIALLALVLLLIGASIYLVISRNALQANPISKPTVADFERLIGTNKVAFIDRLLTVIEQEIAPKTEAGVRQGNKLFGAAVLKKSDLSTVLTATNTESNNPLMHGEITAIFDFYDIPKHQRPVPSDTIFFATHEPCPLCLSGITWSGFDNFFYLFSYEDSRDAYGIPYDLEILDQVFRDKHGSYAEKNKFWMSWGLRDLIAQTPPDQQAAFNARVDALKKAYAAMSVIYQQQKNHGISADVPLK